jgi:ankyrin repeat protein
MQSTSTSSNTEKDVDMKSKKSLSFLRLAKERRFDEIIAVLKQLSHNSAATDAWLTLANNDKFHVVSSCESLHALCMYRPTMAVVQAVMEALARIHHNNVDVTVMVDAAGRTPLHICAAFGASADVTELLMRDSTAVLTPDHARRYPLHWACAHPHGCGSNTNKTQHKKASEDNMVEVINKLIEAYAVAVISPDKNGHSPLDLAAAAQADGRILSALRFVKKILPSNGLLDHTASIETDSRGGGADDVPATLDTVCADDDDDLSSVGSRGVSRHVRRYMSVDQKVPSLVIL